MAKRKKIVWSAKARKDLLRILEYYFLRNGNILFSRKLYKKIKTDVNLLKMQGFLGRTTDYENIRVIAIWDYLIFYEVFPDTILITNIWDTRRNPEDLQ